MKIIKNQKGVTLLEVLTVVAIIAIMSALIIPKYSKYKDSKSLGLARTQLSNDIRTVQNYTFSTMKFNGEFPQGGYGIHFSLSNGYTIFADNGNHIYNSGEGMNNSTDPSGRIILPGGVTITALEVDGTSLSTVDFTCVPPYGEIYINGNNTASALEIEYQNNSGSSDSITLHRFGNIS